MKKTVHIKGMMCSKCAERAKKALEKIPDTTVVSISAERGTAEIESSSSNLNPDLETLVKQAIEEAGYECTGMDDSSD